MADKLTDWLKRNISDGSGARSRPNFRHHGRGRYVATAVPHEAAQVENNKVARARRGLLRCIPLGGLDEVGKNMMVFEHGNDIVIVDMGFQFPEEDMLGVDYVIPDISYLKGKESRIRAVIITHGHLDHIGAIPYLIEKLGFPPIYATTLTQGLIKKRLEEFGLVGKVKQYVINPSAPIRLGSFNCEFFRVNHSIPDGVGVVLKTPAGNIVHTGDFKFDFTPLFQSPADYSRIASVGVLGIDLLFSDSTNALNPGHTKSEKVIGENLDEIIGDAVGRVIIASFSSLIDRIQLVINSAAKHGRKVYVSGRSMVDNIEIASRLGYIKIPSGIVHDVKKLGGVPDDKALILTTGAQGETVSALNRMAMGEHAKVQIKRGDTVILSSTPIPGNERPISSMINGLCRLGAKVIFHQVMDVHTSGHANREDLKLMIKLINPDCLVPVHGELFMRIGHGEAGKELGMKDHQIKILENGSVLEIRDGKVSVSREKVSVNYIMVDGKGMGDTAAEILMDRQIMSENGVLIVLIAADGKTKKIIGNPEIITRGFIYMSESEEVIKEVIPLAKKAYEEITGRDKDVKRGDIKRFIRGSLDRFTHRKLDRRPLILPVIVNK